MGYTYGKQGTHKPSYNNTVWELQGMVIPEKNIDSLQYQMHRTKGLDNFNHSIYWVDAIYRVEFLTDKAH